MRKKLFLYLLFGVSVLIAALFWLLSEVMPETFGAFNLSWAIAIIAGVNGIAFLIWAFVIKDPTTLKIAYIIGGAVLLVIMAVSLAFALALPKSLIAPCVCVTLALVCIIAPLSTRAKRWDEGDNQKPGYQDYRARKAAEEEARANLPEEEEEVPVFEDYRTRKAREAAERAEREQQNEQEEPEPTEPESSDSDK